jgi:hypothetical protein
MAGNRRRFSPLGRFRLKFPVLSLLPGKSSHGDGFHETACTTRKSWSATVVPKAARIWLLDGLDELHDDTEYGLGDALTALPGPKVATCRTGVFAGWRQRLGEDVGAQWRKELEILPLGVRERRTFLAARLPDGGAEALATHIEASAPLRELAGSPLMLALMAELGLPLPNSRVAFYERTEARLGDRRSQGPQHDLVWGRSGAVLDRLADKMKLDRIEAPLALLVEACANDQPLYDALRSSGILTIDRDRACFAFIHLTFQEYHLARALRATAGAALQLHWREASYEETLALLLGMEADADNGDESVAAALDGLVRTGLRLFRDKPEELFQLGRSPIRVALHLLERSGTDRTVVLPKVRSLWPVRKWSHSFKEAVAADRRSPPAVLDLLASDPNAWVRSWAAENPSTPAAALETLARDSDKWVRLGAASNPSTPAATLETLARDPDNEVRGDAASNPSTPAATLETLARDPASEVRLYAARNPWTPAAALEALARDPANEVRGFAARNPWTPAASLEALARDPAILVRERAARNPSTPAATLEALARDPAILVRWSAARNPASLLEALQVSRFTKWIWRCRRALLRPLMYFASPGWTRWLIRQGKRSIAAEPQVAIKAANEGFWQAIGAAPAAGLISLVALAVAWLAGYGAQEWAALKAFWASVLSFVGQ